ncbi:MAG: RluA family pseudouridine synthase [Myxococcales bacterium]|nr:RluA family pseudouridine synthase [Myxococcales bacterium]
MQREAVEPPPGCDPDSIVLSFSVAREHAGLRLDRFIQSRIPRLSRTRAQIIVRACAYRDDGSRRRPSERVQAGERVLLVRPPMDEPDAPREFGVVYEDDDVLVVDKPAGLPMHPSASYHKNTLTYVLRERYGDGAPQIAHRLDRETSGIVVCAKHVEAERALKRCFEDRRTQKRYVAIVRGRVLEAGGRIDAPLGQAEEGPHVMMGVRAAGDGQSAVTEYEVVERRDAHTLVALRPLTGRQHQLRVHLASIGHPIVGDKLYGPEGAAPFLERIETGLTPALIARLGHARHALHAAALTMPHPRSEALLALSAPLPKDLRDLWSRLP